MSNILRYCICCGRHLHAASQFHEGSTVCIFCAALTPQKIAETAVTTARLSEFSGDGRVRREATLRRRREARRDALAVTGKRCCECHQCKPVSEYQNSLTRTDGLQPTCRECAKVRYQIYKYAKTKYDALANWHTVRDALRVKADPAAKK